MTPDAPTAAFPTNLSAAPVPGVANWPETPIYDELAATYGDPLADRHRTGANTAPAAPLS